MPTAVIPDGPERVGPRLTDLLHTYAVQNKMGDVLAKFGSPKADSRESQMGRDEFALANVYTLRAAACERRPRTDRSTMA